MKSDTMKKKCLALALLVASCSLVMAQIPISVSYEYDAAGNRICRKIIPFFATTNGSRADDSTYYVDMLQSVQIKVYPNPTHGKLYLRMMDCPDESAKTLQVYDSQGKKIQEQVGASNYFELDFSSYPTGYYIVELTVGEEKTIWKIIKK